MARMVIGLVVLFSLLAGCASQPASSPQQIEAALNKNAGPVDQYILGPNDVVQVSVWRNPDLSVSVPVRPDGRISVPLVGDVVAAGLTPEELADDVQDKLEQYIRQPQVSVVVTGMNSHEFTDRVRVTGAVQSPMTMPFRDGMTVMDVVLSAGGANPFADLNDAMLYRPMGKEVVAIPVKLDDILTRGDIATNYRLLPGDILTVPERSF
ncbi:sugar ABC transporter substrate-binding protein [Marinobacter halodurans]|uniref:Sugar ABC transporter substrate-binding protein n=1 Tax=Marinobacter halodurans TaxID=2528979 RepID=A0ABY1ZGU1_9GAMM|nr:XrtA/PEP-CTERM system exopolysaccharide export protein [Marinobacter halodurans]TBW51571.1 sugar ABC transporter substrate-binding protein [Marinobacter halodurans]